MSEENTRAVWVLQEYILSVPPHRYSGAWEPDSTEEGEEPYEDYWHDLGAALSWARARAPHVVLHVCVGTGLGERVPFSAGELRIAAYREWDTSTVDTVAHISGYSGSASILEETYEFHSVETFGLVEETQATGGDRSVTRTSLAQGLALDVALDRARARSDVVVVGTGWPGNYEYGNAGSQDYKPDPYPRFPF